MTAPTPPSAMEEAEKIVEWWRSQFAAVFPDDWYPPLQEIIARALNERDEQHGACVGPKKWGALFDEATAKRDKMIAALQAQLREREEENLRLRQDIVDIDQAKRYAEEQLRELRRKTERLSSEGFDVVKEAIDSMLPPKSRSE